MANSITKATQFVNNEQEVVRMFNVHSLFADLIKPVASHTGATISYDKISFASTVQGTYDRDAGYSNKAITFARETKTLSQDKGDSLKLDKMDKEEAQIADGIIHAFNVYTVKVRIPSIDNYVASKLVATTTGVARTKHASAYTVSNILGGLLGDKAKITGKRIRFNECIIYISTSASAVLEEAAFGKGHITFGAWNGNVDAQVKMFDGAKLVEVPSECLGESVEWVIVHPLAFDVYDVYKEVVYFDRIPGFGGRMAELDIGDYYDAWVQPGGEAGIVQNVIEEE